MKTNEKKVSELDLTKMSDKQLNDFLNSESIVKSIKNIKVKEKNSNTNKREMYHYSKLIPKLDTLTKEKQTIEKKKVRNSFRKSRNKFANNIIYYAQTKDISLLKKEIDNYKKVYIKYCTLNDWSILSMCSNNSDADSKELIKNMLLILKPNK